VIPSALGEPDRPDAVAAAEAPRIADYPTVTQSFDGRPNPAQPARPVVVIKTPTHIRSGQASWYCLTGASSCHYAYSGGMYAAAGAALRVGNWRGRIVQVCASGRCIMVTLIDWCLCGGGRIIDLYGDAYRRLAPLSTGTQSVRVGWW
jgi:rare lipoprotein A (peptidoglycan hydrolase)